MRRAILACLAPTVAVLVSCQSGGPQFSDSTSAASIGFSGEADRLDISYEKCRGDPVPGVSVSEDLGGEGPPVDWNVTQRVSLPEVAFFIATRPAGIDGPPVEDASLSVVVDVEDPVEVYGLHIGDLPASDGPDVLTAVGEERARSDWSAEIAESCDG